MVIHVNQLKLCVIGEFIDYMEYVKSLQFEQKPDYKQMINLFRELYVKSGFTEDFIFDWNL